jgi:hypothetical protein
MNGKHTLKLALVLMAMAALVCQLACNGEAAGPGKQTTRTGHDAAPSDRDGEEAAFESFAAEATVPVLMVPEVAAVPEVDGKMDDLYKAVEPVKLRFLSGNNAAPTAPTHVYVVSTEENLCIFFDARTPNPEGLVANVKQRDEPVWTDDYVEVFLDPANQRSADKPYYHIVVNPLGTVADGMGVKGQQDYGWDPNLNSEARIGEDRWTVELVIPFKDLGFEAGQVHKVWTANFNRYARLAGGNEDTAWSPTMSSDSHVPSKFGMLWLQTGDVHNHKQD